MSQLFDWPEHFYLFVSYRVIKDNITRYGFQVGMLNMGFESAVRAHEIYIFCMSHSFSDVLEHEFKAVACAEILDPRAFIHRWLNALPEDAHEDGKPCRAEGNVLQAGRRAG